MSTTNNTAYRVVTDVVDTETGLTIEEGTLHTYNNELKAHLGGQIVTVYPQASGGSDYTETIVNISAAQILNMGTTPIELLPAAGANAYYDIEKVVLEYTHNTTAYTTTNKYLYLDGVSSPAIPPALITATGNAFQIIKPSACFVDPTDEVAYNANISLNQPITFKAWNSSNPTLGDGTLRVKIYHKTITFGA